MKNSCECNKIQFSELSDFIKHNYKGIELRDLLQSIDYHSFPEDHYACSGLLGIFVDLYTRLKENDNDRDEFLEAIGKEDL